VVGRVLVVPARNRASLTLTGRTSLGVLSRNLRCRISTCLGLLSRIVTSSLSKTSNVEVVRLWQALLQSLHVEQFERSLTRLFLEQTSIGVCLGN
jgi:hypothetical protein